MTGKGDLHVVYNIIPLIGHVALLIPSLGGTDSMSLIIISGSFLLL